MRFALFTCLALLCAPFAAAQETPSPEMVVKAQDVYRLALTDEILGDMATRTAQLIVEQVNAKLAGRGKALGGAQSDELIARFSVAFVDEMKAIEPRVVTLYAKHMTERELDLMIEMYSNPEMSAVMAKMPRIMQDMTPLIQSSVPRLVQSVIGGMQSDGLLSNL